MPGVDLILPDIRFLIEERRNIVGLVLTHAHEDHFGALIDLWPRLKVPLYATPFTAALFEARRLSEPGAPKIPVNVVPLGGRLALGPFEIEFDQRRPFDPRIECARDPHPARHRAAYRRLEDRSRPRCRLGDRRGEALPRWATKACSRSSAIRTNACATAARRPRPTWPRRLPSSSAPRPAASAVTTFASHVGPPARGRRCGARRGREVVLVGRAMERVVAGRARDRLSRRRAATSAASRVFGYLPPDKVVALCTGSQGEPRAALPRIAEDEHPEVALRGRATA